jgi:hypothetical protein
MTAHEIEMAREYTPLRARPRPHRARRCSKKNCRWHLRSRESLHQIVVAAWSTNQMSSLAYQRNRAPSRWASEFAHPVHRPGLSGHDGLKSGADQPEPSRASRASAVLVVAVGSRSRRLRITEIGSVWLCGKHAQRLIRTKRDNRLQ